MAVLALALLPPVLPGAAAEALRTGFMWLCHQMPDRTLHLHGEPVALCHRCLGILAGFVAGLAAAPWAPGGARRLAATRQQARALGLAALPLVADWTLGAVGWLANSPVSRSVTGALFGLVAGTLVGLSLMSGPAAAPPRAPANLLADARREGPRVA